MKYFMRRLIPGFRNDVVARAGPCRDGASRLARWAARGSWVTITIVFWNSRLSCSRRSRISPAGGAVEVAGRLVGHQQIGIGDDRPRDRHALLLAAGELTRVMMLAAGEADDS